MSEVTQVAALEAAFKSHHDQLKGWMEKAEGQIKETGDVAGETKSALQKLSESANEIGERIDKLEGRMNSRLPGQEGDQKSLGASFVETDEFKNLSTGRGTVARMECKAIINATGQNQPLVPSDRVGGIIHEPNRRMTVRNLLPVARTTSNLIEFTKENVFTDNAGPQASGSPIELENVTKPESDITFTLSTEPVRTLAHFILASRQVLSDAPALQSYIDSRLRYGLMLEEETQLLSGSGVDGNLNGLITNETAYNRGSSADTKIDTLRKACTQVALSEYSAEAFILNPADWEEIELLKDSQNRYIFANPQGMAAPSMWGKPVIVTNSMTAGTFQVGAYSLAAQIWDREQATVEVSREDNDNFRKNMVTILAEERLALAIYRAAGIVGGSF